VAEQQERLEFTGKFTPEGRPIYKNQWGDFVTERTITVEIPSMGGFVNVPTVLDGQFLSERQAIDVAKSVGGKDPVTGRKLPVFKSVNEAVSEARSRSKDLGPVIEEVFRNKATFE
jgi:hypothetical protein